MNTLAGCGQHFRGGGPPANADFQTRPLMTATRSRAGCCSRYLQSSNRASFSRSVYSTEGLGGPLVVVHLSSSSRPDENPRRGGSVTARRPGPTAYRKMSSRRP